MDSDELKRQNRVTDQMITIYSVLRDRYELRATLLTLGILGSSVVLVACTFLPEEALTMVGISPFMVKVIIGAVSSFVLLLSIAELRVDWKFRARNYADAAESLARLKLKYRRAFDAGSGAAISQEITQAYNETMSALPRIPDKQFLKLKAYHLRKVRLSQMLDHSSGCPLFWLRLRLLREECRRSRHNQLAE